MIIKLAEQELQHCIEFAYECAKNQQEIEFGQADTSPRNKIEIGRDNLIGKIAEVAFAKMINENYGTKVELDFNYYPRGVWDKQDAVINGWRIDVKGTRQGGKWLLVEWSKLNFRNNDDELSHIYVMATVMWDRNIDQPIGGVDLVGCVSLKKLQPGVTNTLILHKGESIPGTSTSLQADNYAVHFTNLEHDWSKVMTYVLNNNPPSFSNFILP